MMTEDSIKEAFCFFNNAYREYQLNKPINKEEKVVNRVRNYLIGKTSLRNLVENNDLVYSNFEKRGFIESDFTIVIRILKKELTGL